MKKTIRFGGWLVGWLGMGPSRLTTPGRKSSLGRWKPWWLSITSATRRLRIVSLRWGFRAFFLKDMAGYFAMCCYLKDIWNLSKNISPQKDAKQEFLDWPTLSSSTNIFQICGSSTKQKTIPTRDLPIFQALKHRGDRWVTVAWTNVKGCTWFIESPPKNILDMVCFHFQSLFFLLPQFLEMFLFWNGGVFFLHATWSTQDMQDYQATLARARNPAGFLIVKLSEMEKVPFWDVGKKSRLMC